VNPPLSSEAVVVLHALRRELLDVHQIAADHRLAPFAVRELLAELTALGYVTSDGLGNAPHELWRLTWRGRHVIA
jgi:DNA-binding IclR family transcriptional regulator